MAGRITRECVERIRDATDIVALIEGYVQLKRSGRNHMGLCPFHEEKTPSFSVTADRGRYKCFGCGESGGAFDFIMGIDGVSFREAAEEPTLDHSQQSGVYPEERAKGAVEGQQPFRLRLDSDLDVVQRQRLDSAPSFLRRVFLGLVDQ